MLACDTNVLFAAVASGAPGHVIALGFLEQHETDREFVVCELVLAELYGLLRNPAVVAKPLAPAPAVDIIQRFRTNRSWRVIDYPGNRLMDEVWRRAAQPGFARTNIYDARLALTLRHHGVAEFATRNLKHFQHYGFAKVWDPLAAGTAT
jgi:toxin-antitoxin system PIN domain toxin